MAEHEFAESREFPAPFVRVRGRVSREGRVQWSPCIRTYKGGTDQPTRDVPDRPAISNRRDASRVNQYVLDFLDYRGDVLESLPTRVRFLSTDRQWAPFVARLPYHSATQAVRFRSGQRELGRLDVPTDRPFFSLLKPEEDSFIDGEGVLHLHWCGHDDQHPSIYYVRYSHNGTDWIRPGVNLHKNDFYLDLREMPGGERCVVEVVATNGYRTSYVRTRHFEVPRKKPELFLGESDGPVLFAQGFSRESGPIVGERIAWLAGDGSVVGRGGTLDVRTLAGGVHVLSVAVADERSISQTAVVGTYEAPTGRRLPSGSGL
jgi:hypothetical protein